jgi:hypothetical protein
MSKEDEDKEEGNTEGCNLVSDIFNSCLFDLNDYSNYEDLP